MSSRKVEGEATTIDVSDDVCPDAKSFTSRRRFFTGGGVHRRRQPVEYARRLGAGDRNRYTP